MSPAPRARYRHRGQSGVSLVEVLVVLGVITPLVLAASSGLFTTVNVSAQSQFRQELEAGFTSATASLAAMPYVPCASAQELTDAYDAWPGRWTPDPGSDLQEAELSVVAVEYWDQPAVTFGGACSPDGGAQLLQVELVDPRGTVSGTMVKRDPDARPGVMP